MGKRRPRTVEFDENLIERFSERFPGVSINFVCNRIISLVLETSVQDMKTLYDDSADHLLEELSKDAHSSGS